MSRVHHSRWVSTWILDPYHCGIVWDSSPGRFRWVVETRIGRAVRHTSPTCYASQDEAVREMFRSLGLAAPGEGGEE